MALSDLVLLATILLLCSRSSCSRTVKVEGGTTPPLPPMVPALYVFGDSTVDGGNDDGASKWNPPYGMDLNPSDHLPVRATNGWTIADYIANFLSLPIVPPYKNATAAAISLTGVNFAYSGAGMLTKTGPPFWTLKDQIRKLQSLIDANLRKALPDANDLATHLGTSIFLLSIGINDYAQHFLYPNNNGDLGHLIPNAFAQILLTQMSSDLTALYGLGARKFLVNNIWPLGCEPRFLNQSSPLAICCNDTVNHMVSPFNSSLPGMLKDLESKLPGAHFSHSNNFDFVTDVKENGIKYGITNTTGLCAKFHPDSILLCADRDSNLYWDPVHTTQAANKLFSTNCYSGNLACTPNIVQLAGTPNIVQLPG